MSTSLAGKVRARLGLYGARGKRRTLRMLDHCIASYTIKFQIIMLDVCHRRSGPYYMIAVDQENPSRRGW